MREDEKDDNNERVKRKSKGKEDIIVFLLVFPLPNLFLSLFLSLVLSFSLNYCLSIIILPSA